MIVGFFGLGAGMITNKAPSPSRAPAEPSLADSHYLQDTMFPKRSHESAVGSLTRLPSGSNGFPRLS